MSEPIKQYIVSIVEATREDKDVYLGASPRGSLGLYRAGQVFAILEGRDFVTPDDIKKVTVPVLAHRIVLHPSARIKDLNKDALVTEIVERVEVPVRG